MFNEVGLAGHITAVLVVGIENPLLAALVLDIHVLKPSVEADGRLAIVLCYLCDQDAALRGKDDVKVTHLVLHLRHFLLQVIHLGTQLNDACPLVFTLLFGKQTLLSLFLQIDS